jgi:DNA-binding response OmpR family regulator
VYTSGADKLCICAHGNRQDTGNTGYVLDDLSSQAPAALPVARVFVVEPNAALRAGIVEILEAERYAVRQCGSLDQVVREDETDHCDVALVAWQSMNGLLSDEHRQDLAECVRRLHLIVMVPQSWGRMLESEDLGGAVLLEKPFHAEELLGCVEAMRTRQDDGAVSNASSLV